MVDTPTLQFLMHSRAQCDNYLSLFSFTLPHFSPSRTASWKQIGIYNWESDGFLYSYKKQWILLSTVAVEIILWNSVNSCICQSVEDNSFSFWMSIANTSSTTSLYHLYWTVLLIQFRNIHVIFSDSTFYIDFPRDASMDDHIQRK